ncbi:MAG: alpha/beta hydrolase [Deltaproteobacteria bacterium]
MRRFIKIPGIVLLFGLALWFTGPVETLDLTRLSAAEVPVGNLDAWLVAEEAKVPGITKGAQKEIIWAGEPGTRTKIAVVYLHGWSATRQEVSPVTEEVAKALGANVFFTRYTGHGLDGAALGKATAGDWLQDTGEALEIGHRLGDTVIVISASTGGSLALLAAVLGDRVDGYVLISPNFGLHHPLAFLLSWPWARDFVPFLVGEIIEWEPRSAEHAKFWTNRYPSTVLLPVATVAKAARDADYSTMTAPVLAIFSDDDQVVRPDLTRLVLAGWGGPVTLFTPKLAAGGDPFNHMIAGNIHSPAMTAPVTAEILNWIAASF